MPKQSADSRPIDPLNVSHKVLPSGGTDAPAWTAEASGNALITLPPDGELLPESLARPWATTPIDLWAALQAAGVGAWRAPPSPLVQLDVWVRRRAPLAICVGRYLAECAVGQSPHTLLAKCRDLLAFVCWFVQINQHAEPAHWLSRDSRLFVRHLEGEGRSPVSINRSLASLRHFAKWLHEQPGGIFLRSGLPTRGVRELVCEEADCKKLDRREMHALFKAADNLVTLAQHRRARPQRNRAILALLYYTGMRVQELCALQRCQYVGHHLVDVVRKGRVRSKKLYLVAEARRALEAYLQQERPLDDPQAEAEPLLLAQAGRSGLDRRDVARALAQLADEANKRRNTPIHLHPHRLRHTFASEFRAKSQSDAETAQALGHTSLKYVGRYTRQTDAERQQQLDELFGDSALPAAPAAADRQPQEPL